MSGRSKSILGGGGVSGGAGTCGAARSRASSLGVISGHDVWAIQGSVGSARQKPAMANHFFVTFLPTSALPFGKGFQEQACAEVALVDPLPPPCGRSATR